MASSNQKVTNVKMGSLNQTAPKKKLSEEKRDMISGYLYIAPFFIIFAVR